MGQFPLFPFVSTDDAEVRMLNVLSSRVRIRTNKGEQRKIDMIRGRFSVLPFVIEFSVNDCREVEGREGIIRV